MNINLKPFLCFCVMSCVTVMSFGHAETHKSLVSLIEPESVTTLTLQEAILQALQNNLDISISRQTRDVRVTDIVFEQAKFDPTVTLSGRYDRSITALNQAVLSGSGAVGVIMNEPAPFNQSQSNVSTGFSQDLLTGGNYELKWESTRNSIADKALSGLFNPSYTSSLLLNLSQPLLQGFGTDVNHTAITIAQNTAQLEHFVFVDQVLNVVADVERAYWELIFMRKNKQVANAHLQAAQELLANNHARVEAGILAAVDVLQAKASVASRVEDVLIAQKAVRDQEDQLRRLLVGSEEELRKSIVVVPLDHPIKTARTFHVPDVIDLALQRRPEILQAAKTIESSQLNVRVAKNQLLPNLSFQGTVGLSGLGKDPTDTFNRTFEGEFYNAGAGLLLSYPLGNRSAKSQYRQRQYETTRARSALQNVRQQVIVDVKEAVRRIQTDLKRIQITQAARKVAERQLNAEQERLNLGLSTTRLVLDLQSDLAMARGNELRAIMDYNQSLANLDRATAAKLERYQISL
ncbi:MAG: hypothetical protein GKS05_10570 [Nitrospirales bacterium]|nr:hypothetical protein [Nitrospirales bacterium]